MVPDKDGGIEIFIQKAGERFNNCSITKISCQDLFREKLQYGTFLALSKHSI